MAGRIRKELGKHPREASSAERRKLEKKVRLSKERSPEVGRVKAILRSSPSKKGDAGAPATEERSSPLGKKAIVIRGEHRVEDSERTAEIPCPPVVEIVDSPEGAPSEAQGEPVVEGPPSDGLEVDDVALKVVEVREELPLKEVRGASEQAEALMESAGEEQAPVIGGALLGEEER